MLFSWNKCKKFKNLSMLFLKKIIKSENSTQQNKKISQYNEIIK